MFGFFDRIKLLMFLAVFAGPGFAYVAFNEINGIKHTLADGVETVGSVNGGSVERHRYSNSYKLDVSWVDANGGPHAERLTVSSVFAQQVISGEYVTIDAVHVKYVPNDPKAPVLVVEDAAQRLQDEQLLFYLACAAGVIGSIGSLFLLINGSGKRKKDDAEQDEILRKMREGQT